MSQHTTAIMNDKKTSVYAGLDIAKASLQLHLQSKFFDLPNTAEGQAQLIKRLTAIPGVRSSSKSPCRTGHRSHRLWRRSSSR